MSLAFATIIRGSIMSKIHNIVVQSKYEKTHHKLQQKQNYYHLVGNFV